MAEAAVQEIEQREKWRTKSGTIENVSHADSTYGKLNASNFLAHPLQSTTTQGIDKNVGNPPSPPSTSENCYGTNPWDGKSVDEWLQGGSDISDRFNDLVRRLTIIMKYIQLQMSYLLFYYKKSNSFLLFFAGERLIASIPAALYWTSMNHYLTMKVVVLTVLE